MPRTDTPNTSGFQGANRRLARAESGMNDRHGSPWWLSCLSMVLLIVQGTFMSVVLRYSRVSTSSLSGTSSYLPSVSVSIAECIKLSICVLYMFLCPSSVDSPDRSTTTLPVLASIYGRNKTKQRRAASGVMNIFRDSVPMALPAAMFVMQQVLLIWSATYLDAVTYQIFTQAFKLVPTAVFSRLLLGQRLRPAQWLSIPTLALGVVCITANTNSGHKVSTGASSGQAESYFYYLAMAACSIAGLSSSYAGVYFELYVKGKLAASLVKRNFQLGLYGVPFSCLYALIRDGGAIRERGILHGFSSAAWGVVILQVFGGFIIALVVKHCDNILKNFALAGSVILTVIISIPLFGQWPSSFFLLGVSIVLLSVFMYSGAVGAIIGNRTKLVVWGLGLAFVAWDAWAERVTQQQRAEFVTIRLPELNGNVT